MSYIAGTSYSVVEEEKNYHVPRPIAVGRNSNGEELPLSHSPFMAVTKIMPDAACAEITHCTPDNI